MSSSATSLPVEPFDAYVRRRARSAVAWTRGEIVTAAVGLLRGCRRATGRSSGAVWWITAEGRPVLVPADSGPDVVEATAEALAHVGSIAPDDTTRDLVARTRDSVLSGPPREWEEGERRLFAHAAPTPLVLGPLTPVIAETPPPGDDAGHLGSGVTAFVDADLADAARAALADLRERWRRAPRWRAAAVGVSVATVIVVAAAALLPLGAAPGPTSAASAGSTADRTGGAPPATAEPTPRWSVDPRMPLSDDSEKIARALFAEIEGCRADAACVTAHEEGSSFTREPLLHGAAEGDISLIEDFGGVVVVRVADDTSAQYVTLVRLNDRWLVRAVETVTDQPS